MTEKLRLDIPIILPEVPDAADACVARLISQLRGRSGIEDVHVAGASASGQAQLCIHYDPYVIPLARIRELALSVGAKITERFGHALWRVEGIGHERRARTVAERLRSLPGVLEADANAAGLVRIEFDRTHTSEQAVSDALRRMGIRAAQPPERSRSTPATDAQPSQLHEGHDHREAGTEEHSHEHDGIFGTNSELIFSLACGVALGVGFAIEKMAASAGYWLSLGCYLFAYFLGGFFTLREAVDNLRLRKFEIDTLMLVAAAGAATLGAWAEGALD